MLRRARKRKPQRNNTPTSIWPAGAIFSCLFLYCIMHMFKMLRVCVCGASPKLSNGDMLGSPWNYSIVLVLFLPCCTYDESRDQLDSLCSNNKREQQIKLKQILFDRDFYCPGVGNKAMHVLKFPYTIGCKCILMLNQSRGGGTKVKHRAK